MSGKSLEDLLGDAEIAEFERAFGKAFAASGQGPDVEGQEGCSCSCTCDCDDEGRVARFGGKLGTSLGDKASNLMTPG